MKGIRRVQATFIAGTISTYNQAMKELTPKQKKSTIAAAVFLALLLIMSALGALPFLGDLFNEDTLGRSHGIETPPPTISPTEMASDGLRHEVSVELERVILVRVVDGDTIIVLDRNGEEKYVRLIGINAPESVSPQESKNTHEGDLASEHLKKIIEPGLALYLQKDTTDTDDYGRLLRYVWVMPPKDFTDSEEISIKMLNAKMLYDGYAVAHKYKPNDAYFEIFKSFQLEALHDERGLWENGVNWSQAL